MVMLFSKKLIFLIVFLTVYSNFIFPQKEKSLYIPKHIIDTLVCDPLNEILYKDFDLPDLKTDNNKIHIRIIIKNQIIVLKNELDNYNGFVLNKLYKVNNGFSRKPGYSNFEYKHICKKMREKTDIDSVIVKTLIYKFLDLELNKMNDYSEIDGWDINFNGIHVEIEYSTPYEYRYMEFFSPNHQDKGLQEAQLIEVFLVELYKLLKLKNMSEDFYQSLKQGRYISNKCENSMIWIKK